MSIIIDDFFSFLDSSFLIARMAVVETGYIWGPPAPIFYRYGLFEGLWEATNCLVNSTILELSGYFYYDVELVL